MGVRMNKNQVKGRARLVKGKATKLTGKLLHKPKLVAKGQLQEVSGTIEATWGDARSVASRKATAAKRTLRKETGAAEKSLASAARTLRKKGSAAGKGVAGATRQAAAGARRAGKRVASRAK